MSSDPKAETFEEWRVTGKPTGSYPPYDFTWSPLLNPHLGDPEQSATRFVALVTAGGGWDEGPHLSHRTVTVTEWEAFAP